MHPLAERLLKHILREELLHAGERVGVAVSGGIDSVALLRLLIELRGELGIVLSVVHFNHKLRGEESEADEEFVAEVARSHDLQFFVDGKHVALQAREERISLEAAARELRYGFFRSLILKGDAGLGSSSIPASDDMAQEVKTPTLPHKTREGWGTRANSEITSKLDKIATGHILDDQAETVLMRVVRGSGLRGLGAIYPRIAVESEDGSAAGEIVRPLLAVRRRELEQYLADVNQSWREDSSNEQTHFTRNRVRKVLVPLLEKEFNPAVAENLSELAEIARGEEDYWENEIAGWMGTAVHWTEPEWARTGSNSLVQIATLERFQPSANDAGQVRQPELQSRIAESPWLVMNASVDRRWLVSEPMAVQRRLVKAVGDEAGIPLEFKHVEEVVRFAGEHGPTGKALSLPLGWKVVREHEQLVFVTPDLRRDAPAGDYEYTLEVPGRVVVAETGWVIEAMKVSAGAREGYNADHLLDPDSVPGPLRVRNWRPGDRFWPAHSKSPKKVKELLQERHVPQAERKLWPVVVCGEEIVWMRGWPVSSKFVGKAGREAIFIQEKPLSARGST